MTSGNVDLLWQGVSLLEELDNGLYTGVPAGLATSGVGSHIRHCLDFYGSFLRGYEEGKIDYDWRQRNELIEKDRAAARARLEATISELCRLPSTDAERVLLVKQECGQSGDPAAWSRSSVSRELQFLLSHTVHHYALIAMLLRLQGYETLREFGVAPSTLKYWEATS